MLLRLLHRTTFVYAGHARDSFNEVRLQPVDSDTQACVRFSLRITPETPARRYLDMHGNAVHYFDLAEGHERLVVEAESEVETVPDAGRTPVPVVPFSSLEGHPETEMQAEFATESRYVPLAPEIWRESRDALEGGATDVWNDACRIGRHVHRLISYKPNITGVSTLATDALKLKAGVCQDFAHIMLGLCRVSGIPARYVSGYFLNPRIRPDEIEASHAWVEALVPGFGWAAYDPTHDRPADERYVKVAVGRDYADVPPVSGTYRGAPTRELLVEVQVREAAALSPAATPD